jgi:tetratricopeptide (TPR) repeat protein
MLHTSVNGIAASYATTHIWSVAASPGSAARALPWLSAEEVARAMAMPPAAAEARANEAMRANPCDPHARFLLADALVRQGRADEARTILEALAQSQPQMEHVWRRLGQVLARSSERAHAIEAFERALDLELCGRDAWFGLGNLLPFSQTGKRAGSAPSNAVAEIEHALAHDRLDAADVLSRALLGAQYDDAAALKIRADVLIHRSRWLEAKGLLVRALEIAPGDVAGRFRYATMMFAHGEFGECVPQIERLLGYDCDMPLLRGAMAMALALEGNYARGIEVFETFIGNDDSHPGLWHAYARVLRWAGDRRMGAAFLRATKILPCLSSAWYALATVRSFRWDEGLALQLRTQLMRPDLAIEDRALMQFTLAKAVANFGRYAEAFENFHASKTMLRKTAEYLPKASQTAWRQTRLLFTPAFLRKYAGAGASARDPIFIVGMPRAGSTLVEQIVSAHSQVEGLGELTLLPTLVENLYTNAGGPQHWPLLLRRLQSPDFRGLGKEYLRMARASRKTDAPLFTDKQPNNFQLTGLIHLMLPNAKIVDVRRHPLDCGLSCFTHYFPQGHRFACDLGDIGTRYVDYVRLMAHFDEVLPGKVHRVIYERLVENFETEVRRLLEYLGLPFEPECLKFFQNRRMVATLSYEQVVMPLYDTGIGQWRRYEPWLGPLKDALGCVLEAYPGVPRFFPDLQATSRSARSLGEIGGRFGNMKGVRQRPFSNASGVPA